MATTNDDILLELQNITLQLKKIKNISKSQIAPEIQEKNNIKND